MVEAFNHWAGPEEKIQSFYCDNAPELLKAAKTRGWRCPTSTPGIPQTNGLAERTVRRVKEGARCNLGLSGLTLYWWIFAVRAFCFAHNTLMVEGTSPYFERHQVHYKGEHVHHGALIDFMPQPETRRDGLDTQTMKGLFVGYHVLPGGVHHGD